MLFLISAFLITTGTWEIAVTRETMTLEYCKILIITALRFMVCIVKEKLFSGHLFKNGKTEFMQHYCSRRETAITGERLNSTPNTIRDKWNL